MDPASCEATVSKGMRGYITRDQFEAIRSRLALQAIPPMRVCCQLKADELNRCDPFGRTWIIGDEYYEVL